MKTKHLARAAAAVLAITLVACSAIAPQPTATPQPTLTPLPTDTAQPTNTPAPTSTPVPPTAVAATPTFPATLIVNGVDPVQVLLSNGFAYAGGQQVGACASSCAVYDNAKVDLRVLVYSDGTLSTTATIGVNSAAQADVMFGVVDKIYGTGMADWIKNNVPAVMQGQAPDGKVGSFAAHMESPAAGVITITVVPSQ